MATTATQRSCSAASRRVGLSSGTRMSRTTRITRREGSVSMPPNRSLPLPAIRDLVPIRHRAIPVGVLVVMLTACHTASVQTVVPPSIASELQPFGFDASVAIACRGDSTGVAPGTMPIDILLVFDSTASSTALMVGYSRTPSRDQAPVLAVELQPIGTTRGIGQSCGPRGATVKATPARFSELVIWFTTSVPIRVTVRDPTWRALTTQTFTAETPRPFELRWR